MRTHLAATIPVTAVGPSLSPDHGWHQLLHRNCFSEKTEPFSTNAHRSEWNALGEPRAEKGVGLGYTKTKVQGSPVQNGERQVRNRHSLQLSTLTSFPSSPLPFSHIHHGANMALGMDCLTARRTKSYNRALVVSAAPLEDGLLYQVWVLRTI